MNSLSIIIPSRNEEFLKQTIDDILDKIQGDTEVIARLDGAWANPIVPDNDRVKLIYSSKAIGQRAAQNECARLSRAKYVMKVDAHCAFKRGFDVEMFKAFDELNKENITMVPVMRNLWAFDWKCHKCGKRWYQDKMHDKCINENCDGKGDDIRKKIKWKAKESPQSTSYRFNKELEFKYFSAYKKKQKGDLVETMSLQGSCFMTTRENYWENELCDEALGSWGGQGAEVAIKTWLSGGRVICNKRTWYAHMFRTKAGAGFGFPYPNPAREQMSAKNKLRKIFLNDNWPKATRKLQWLVDKFAPVPDWHN